MNSFDLLFWILGAWLLVRIMNGESHRLWPVLGLVIGLGLLNKISMIWFAGALVPALLLTEHRRHFLTPWPWLAGLVAVLCFAPHILWQYANDWPTIEFMQNAAEQKMASSTPGEYLAAQVLNMNPGTLLVWAVGLGYLLFYRGAKQHRLLGIIYLLVLLLLILNQTSRAGYLMPAYPMLFAAGAIALERFIANVRWNWLKPVFYANHVLATALVAPLAMPVLGQESYQNYAAALGMKPSTEERKEVGKLPQFFADMHGWPELADAVAQVYRSLPEKQKSNVTVLTDNYGEAGAIDFFGKELGVPRAISGHNSYWLWGPGGSLETVIKVGGSTEWLNRLFHDVEEVTRVHCEYCMPYEDNLPIFICRDPVAPVNELWPDLKNFN